MRRHLHLAVGLVLLILVTPLGAQTKPSGAPPELEAWRDWVLYDQEKVQCPSLYQMPNPKLCAWPSRLELDIAADGGKFRQTWRVFAPTRVPLPGSASSWPARVRRDGSVEEPVVPMPGAQETPSVHLDPGTYTLTGTWTWSQPPALLPIPRETGLLTLQYLGRQVAQPRREASGALLLRARAEPAVDEDRLQVRVFRRLREAIPFSITTRIELDVSGKSREVTLGDPLPTGFRLTSVSSNLPLRRDENGAWRLQVRSGSWVIDLESVSSDIPDEIAYPSAEPRRHENELWVYEADNRLRAVTPRGPSSVDPSQTRLPPEWHHLPAYFLELEQSLKLQEKQRGFQRLPSNKLNLQRTLWLDQGGGGATFRDVLSGEVHRDWRLDMRTPFQPGRMHIRGEGDQLITLDPASSQPGIAIRQSDLNLEVDGRIEDLPRSLPATGWQTDLDGLTMTVRLPVGWSLFTAWGPSSVHGDWLRSWRLWDLFWVLMLAGALWKLYGVGPAALGLTTFVLLHNQLNAPHWSWLSLFAAIALERVLPEGKLQALTRVWKWLTALILIITTVGFLIQQILGVFYPQLSFPNFAQQTIQDGLAYPQSEMSIDEAYEQEVPAKKMLQRKQQELDLLRREGNIQQSVLNQEAIKKYRVKKPTAQIQTGPGIPDWQGKQASLYWQGPVDHTETLTILAVPPWLNRLTTLARIAALLGLLRLLWRSRSTGGAQPPPRRVVAATASLLLACLPGLAQEKTAPTQDLLNAYRERLVRPAPCFPNCAAISEAVLNLRGDRLEIRLEVSTETRVAVPLPGRPQAVRVDRAPAEALRLDTNGTLQVALPRGTHRVTTEQRINRNGPFSLSFPLRPYRVAVQAPSWQVVGLNPDGTMGAQLEFRPEAATTPSPGNRDKPEEGEIIKVSPLFQLTRTLDFDLVWQVTTIATLQNREGVIRQVPLLPGEQVLSPGFQVEKGMLRLELSPDRPQVSWTSLLEPVAQVTLTAPDKVAWVENWTLSASRVWDIEWSGTPLIDYLKSDGTWQPSWRPRPGETLTVSLSRPDALTGQTLTLDQVSWDADIGQRRQNHRLTLNVRASLGGEFSLPIQEGMDIEDLKVHGVSRPVIIEDQRLQIAYHPGPQAVEVTWKQQSDSMTHFRWPDLDLGHAAVNLRLNASVPHNRWILWASGPVQGPAVLFWPLLVAIFLIAYGLKKLPGLPMSFGSWVFLGLGMVQLNIPSALIAVAWFVALERFGRLTANSSARGILRLGQIGLAILTSWFFIVLIVVLHNGLLGEPNMYITGNGSNETYLAWYQERTTGPLPGVGVWTLPVWSFRVLMLFWALWLVNSILKWLRWGWSNFTKPAPFSPTPPKKPTPGPAKSAAPSAPKAAEPTAKPAEPAARPAESSAKPAEPAPPQEKSEP
ncbi:hypothetical protein SCOR_06650 [Sulfidibacter corallicola]|uniref:Uncharacterized protein n=1 Tax=Sulfidibacter corallicola TaxID=2818388 RepID=A0A8A4TPS9_SULCO|nr:hypothetical protein [Sulfidibacter corallicola]QTD51553.1 hypothetical protein J3U87_03710 [Sulfidibacter corallicola]